MGILDLGGAGLAGGINSLIQGGFNWVGDMLGISSLKREEKSKKRLMDYEAQLNEQAAQNAFGRTKELYRQSYLDNTYQNKVQQMEDAGLSVGLMYGGGGGAGGGGGSTTAQAQGGTGPQSANGGAEIAMLGLQAKSVEAEVQLKKAQAEEAEARAAAERASTSKTEEETETTKQIRQYLVENERQAGIAKWLANKIQEYWLENDTQSGEVQLWKNSKLEETAVITPWSQEGQTAMWGLLKTAAEAEESTEGANLNAAMAALNDERKKWYFMEVITNMVQANAHETEAAAKKLATLFETGELTNWKTWFNVGITATDRIINAVEVGGGIMTRKAVAQRLGKGQGEMGKIITETKTQKAR